MGYGGLAGLANWVDSLNMFSPDPDLPFDKLGSLILDDHHHGRRNAPKTPLATARDPRKCAHQMLRHLLVLGRRPPTRIAAVVDNHVDIPRAVAAEGDAELGIWKGTAELCWGWMDAVG